jgi:hypothetical protein
MSVQEIEIKVNKIRGSFAVDGMILTDDELNLMRRQLKGEITADNAIAEIIDRLGYSKYETKKAI